MDTMISMNIIRRAGVLSAGLSAAVAAVLLAGPGVAGASTGTRYASAEQVGYAATGAQFDVVRATVYLRNPAQYAGVVGQYSHSVQLWSSDLVMVLGVSASTSGSGYTPYAKIFDARSHQLLASNPAAEWCDPENNCSQTIGSFPAGDTVTFLLQYDLPGNHLILVARDITPGADNGMRFWAGTGFSTRESFTQARVGTEFGSGPWTAPSSFTHPAAWTRIATYSGVVLATYSGHYSTLASWFVHHKIFMAAITGSLIDVEAAPADLYNGGGSFQDWLAPAGVNGPAQPPQG
jgi:hypothetical protein